MLIKALIFDKVLVVSVNHKCNKINLKVLKFQSGLTNYTQKIDIFKAIEIVTNIFKKVVDFADVKIVI